MISSFSTLNDLISMGATQIPTGCGISQVNIEMNDWFEHDCPVLIYNGEGSQACEGGVVLDRSELKELMNQCNVSDEGVIAYYALGHERTHYAQLKEAGGAAKYCQNYSIPQKAQLLEIEADFVAGVFLGKSLLEHDINFLLLPPFAEIIGNANWPKGYHPAPEQRVQAIMRGLNIGAFWVQQGQPIPVADMRDLGKQIATHLQNGLKASGFYRY